VYLTTQMDGLHGTCRMQLQSALAIALRKWRVKIVRKRSRESGPLISEESDNWFVNMIYPKAIY